MKNIKYIFHLHEKRDENAEIKFFSLAENGLFVEIFFRFK